LEVFFARDRRKFICVRLSVKKAAPPKAERGAWVSPPSRKSAQRSEADNPYLSGSEAPLQGSRRNAVKPTILI